ncbi:MAG: DUF4857 domain-containing protein [Verrucomicrobiae bacterium]|nr:DUF4857 domain-containing protein [Verrucomicrobiae bacterium]
MKTIARILFLTVGIFLLAHYLPEGYRLLVAKKRPRPPIVFYSCLQKEFFFYRYSDHGLAMVDERGTNYVREDFEQLLPLDNYLQLLKNGTLPASIDGVDLTVDKLKRERLSLRVRPDLMDSPVIPLYPLLEAESGRVRLAMPDDFMRLSDRVEFVIAASNVVDTAKSDRFTRAFAAAGFLFPAQIIAGNATTLKPYDEGYFLVDKSGATFQLRQVRGEPELKRISAMVAPDAKAQWETLKPKFIMVQEGETHELRAFLIGADDRAYLAVGKDYRLVPLPLDHYEPKHASLALRGDLLNRLVTVTSDEGVEAVALNRNYEVVRRFHESLPDFRESPAGKVRAVIFPFTLSFESDASNFYGCALEFGSRGALLLNVVWLILVSGWFAFRKQLGIRRLPDLVAVGVGGILGVILALILPPAD